MKEKFEMVAKTFQGLEDVLAKELSNLDAENIKVGRRMVSFEGDLETLYRANLCCRTALRILKPIYKFIAKDADSLYDLVKEYDWTKVLSLDKTFAIDTVINSNEFTHSRFVTYRVKDAIVDFFKDKFGPDKRPGVRLQDADVVINVHISGDRVTLSLDSSGESLHKRGYRVAQTEAPINEVLAAGIILKSGWNGQCPLVDPMCGSGTFLVEAALIAANINPGIYRKKFAFEQWSDFDADLFDSLYNDESEERDFDYKIYGADISPKAVSIAMENVKSAGVAKYVDIQIKPISQWDDAPENCMVITNPPYGERISSNDMEGLYSTIGSKLKHVFKGSAWIIGYRDEYFHKIGLTPSSKTPILNGSLECELREYVVFDGDYASFRKSGGKIKDNKKVDQSKDLPRRLSDKEWKAQARKQGMGGKDSRGKGEKRRSALEEKYAPKTRRFDKSSRRKSSDDFNPENPLAERRNVHALKSVVGKRPSIPNMVKRGWKRSQQEEDED